MLPEQVLDKSGPLARVWIASHWERKISKSQFLQTNLEKTIDAITTTQDVPMALRFQGQLLLGVVRIYSRKTRYLLEDCNEALDKIKMAFKKGNVNMPDIQHTTASKKSITLPDRLTEFEVLMADEPLVEIDMDANDPLLDSLSQMASSQDITLSDISFAWDFQHNPMLDTEQGRALDEAEHARVEDFDMESVEQGRRDAEGAVDTMNLEVGDVDNPLAKGRYEDKSNMLDFDDFEFDDDFGQIAQPTTVEEEFQAPQSPDIVSSLNHSGLMRDEDFAMFDTAQLEVVQPPRRRRRRLVVDRVTEIPHDQLRQNVQDTSAIVDLNANIRKRGPATTKINWKKPVACSPGTTLDALYSRLNARRRPHPMNVPPAIAEDILELDAPLRDENAMGIEAGPNNGFDFDDFEFDDTPFPPAEQQQQQQQQQDNGIMEEADISMNTQSSQSASMSQKAHETLELIQDKAQSVGSTNGGYGVSFGDLGATTKAEAARRFYDILLLTTKERVKVKQTQAFGEILIRC